MYHCRITLFKNKKRIARARETNTTTRSAAEWRVRRWYGLPGRPCQQRVVVVVCVRSTRPPPPTSGARERVLRVRADDAVGGTGTGGRRVEDGRQAREMDRGRPTGKHARTRLTDGGRRGGGRGDARAFSSPPRCPPRQRLRRRRAGLVGVVAGRWACSSSRPMDDEPRRRRRQRRRRRGDGGRRGDGNAAAPPRKMKENINFRTPRAAANATSIIIKIVVFILASAS